MKKLISLFAVVIFMTGIVVAQNEVESTVSGKKHTQTINQKGDDQKIIMNQSGVNMGNTAIITQENYQQGYQEAEVIQGNEKNMANIYMNMKRGNNAINDAYVKQIGTHNEAIQNFNGVKLYGDIDQDGTGNYSWQQMGNNGRGSNNARGTMKTSVDIEGNYNKTYQQIIGTATGTNKDNNESTIQIQESSQNKEVRTYQNGTYNTANVKLKNHASENKLVYARQLGRENTSDIKLKNHSSENKDVRSYQNGEFNNSEIILTNNSDNNYYIGSRQEGDDNSTYVKLDNSDYNYVNVDQMLDDNTTSLWFNQANKNTVNVWQGSGVNMVSETISGSGHNISIKQNR